jgi:hypothetical protein
VSAWALDLSAGRDTRLGPVGKEQSSFYDKAKKCVFAGVITLGNLFISDKGIPSPISLVGDVIIMDWGGGCLLYTQKGLLHAYTNFGTTVGSTTECCVIAQSAFALPLLLGTCYFGTAAVGAFFVYGGGCRAWETVKTLRDGKCEWGAIFPNLP